MADMLLPLFPLKVVLFPRTEIPLHIFEERYQEMIGECLLNQSEFGIVLVMDEGLASIGCSASITQVIRKFEDGRMDIVVRGQRRFDLTSIDQERSFLRGEAEFFDDDEDASAVDETQRQRAMELFEQLAERLVNAPAGEQAGEPLPPPDPNDEQLSFQIAARLPVDLPFRQTLLQNRSEAYRIGRIILYLEKMALRLTRLSEAQAKAGSNGRGH
jgi:ATP-dependent Lon protease